MNQLSSRELVSSIMQELVDLGPRPHGSSASARAAAYLSGVLHKHGLGVKEHRFTAQAPVEVARLALELDGQTVPVQCEPFLESPPGLAEGTVHFDGYLRVWGTYEWECWSVRRDAEALGYLVGCALGEPIAQHLPAEVPRLPHALVSQPSSELLRSALSAGSAVKASLSVEPSVLAEGTCLRAFAGVDPLGRPGSAVPLIVAHYDTVPASPGAYDNAAGTAAAVAASLALSGRGVFPHLVLTGGEELGLSGSRALVNELSGAGRLGAISTAVVLDGGGRGRVAEAWLSAPDLDAGITAAFRGACKAHGYSALVRRPAPPGSDHAAFSEAGIPAVMFTVNDTAILHRPSDTFDERKVSASLWLAEAAERTVAWLNDRDEPVRSGTHEAVKEATL